MSPSFRHSLADVRFSPDYVCFPPKSRRKWVHEFESVVDPKLTFAMTQIVDLG